MNKAVLPMLFALILLGNGLRSVISSTVFVSEGTFASFLKISVAQTSMIIELLLGAVLLSLLVSPWMIARFSIQWLTSVMCLIASGAAFGLSALFWIAPPVETREALVIVLFPLVGFSLATMAPVTQLLTDWGRDKHKKLLTGVWVAAVPTAFLVTPQLVRVIAPRNGLDVFFAGFAIVPLLLTIAIWTLRAPSNAVKMDARSPSFLTLVPAILTLIAFEVTTLLVTMSGISSAITQSSALLFVVTLGYLIYNRRSTQTSNPADPATVRIFIFLFLVNVATTGFYDTAYLVLHMCSNTLIADRTTLGAIAQVCAVIGATALLSRFPIQRILMAIGGALVIIGLLSYLLYFNYPVYEVYVGTKAITGFGTGLLTTSAIFAVSNSNSKKAGLSLFIAFVIIIGSEVGLELFEILIQLLEQVKISSDTSYKMVFVAQVVFVVVAMPFVLLKTR